VNTSILIFWLAVILLGLLLLGFLLVRRPRPRPHGTALGPPEEPEPREGDEEHLL
jgi:hypothetical protein